MRNSLQYYGCEMGKTYYDKDRREFVLNYHHNGQTIEERYSLNDVLHIWQPIEKTNGWCMTIELRNRSKCPFSGALHKFLTFPTGKEACFDMFLRMSNDYQESMMFLRRN